MDPETSWEYSVHIPNDPRAIPIARHTLRSILTAHHLAGLTEDAELLATELLTNAVRHTEGPASLRVRWCGESLRLGVWDMDSRAPDFRPIDHDDEGGRGLYLVEMCADDWGWFTLSDQLLGPNGKFVWCEIAPKEARTASVLRCDRAA
ncbi:ATP-binding protein [Streptomyces sp. NPDC048483]|uniref:ATP-binding protein n=1 Tax=Streptomyces sp. NPDC048483 TaxID=3154927 RepID=UPI0034272765